MVRPDQLEPDRAMLLVIDVQAKLLPLIVDHQQLIEASRKLLIGMAIFDLPLLFTEQYAKGLGHTVDPLLAFARRPGAQIVEKPSFSAWGDEPVRNAIRRIDRPQVIVAGIETHVCVLQTTLDLCTVDFDVYVCADAVGARSRFDHQVALDRMRRAGAHVVTAESALFEMCDRSDRPKFKELLEVIKAHPPIER